MREDERDGEGGDGEREPEGGITNKTCSCRRGRYDMQLQ